MRYVQPTTVREALEQLATGDAFDVHVWGGGTSLALLMQQGLMAPELLVGVRRIPDLRGVQLDRTGGVRIGAATTLREIERSSTLATIFPSVTTTAGLIGNVRVRNVATLGGHLVHADPAQDLPPLLLALNAAVELASPAGARAVRLDEFFVDTMATTLKSGELVTGVRIPVDARERRTVYHKYTPRSRDDFATVGVAVSVAFHDDGAAFEDVRIAIGGAGPVAFRAVGAERALEGVGPTPRAVADAAALAAEACEPWDDARGSASYKQAMARVWTDRLLTRLGASRGTRA